MKHIINYIIVNCFIAICILGCGETSPSKSNVLDSSVDKKNSLGDGRTFASSNGNG